VSSELSGKGIAMLLAIHGAVRRDLDRLPRSVTVLANPALSRGDRVVGAVGLTAYWDCFAAQLHHHHSVEDAEVFPYLRNTLGSRSTEVMDAMAHEHDDIDRAQDDAQIAVLALVADPTADNATTLLELLHTFQQVVLGHLVHEEAAALPLIVEGFDDEYWSAFMSRRQQDAGPDAFLPWVLDSAPEPAVAQVTGALPPPVRDLLVRQWTPAHDALVSALPR
jgi:iron-sulfur cluster repair protein YtfE (RIC family)